MTALTILSIYYMALLVICNLEVHRQSCRGYLVANLSDYPWILGQKSNWRQIDKSRQKVAQNFTKLRPFLRGLLKPQFPASPLKQRVTAKWTKNDKSIQKVSQKLTKVGTKKGPNMWKYRCRKNGKTNYFSLIERRIRWSAKKLQKSSQNFIFCRKYYI